MKKIISIILTIAMLICSSQVLAYDNESNTGIVKTGGYSSGVITGGGDMYWEDPLYYDVSPYHWAYDSIMRVSDKGWFSGYPDNTFRPNDSITRAEACKVFVEFLGFSVTPINESSFYDVDAQEWYAPYIEAGKELFPTHTTLQGKTPFNPDMPVTREDTTYALVKALGCMNHVKIADQSVLKMFKDQNSISDTIKPYVAVALTENLVAGFEDSTFRGQDPLTRAQFSVLLARASNHGFHDYKAKIESVSLVCGEEVSLDIGDVLNLNATAVMSDNTNKNYSDIKPYIISGKKAVTIDDSNSVTAIDVGVAKIGFEDDYLKNTTLTITVKTPSTKPFLKIYDYPDETSDATAIIKGKSTDVNGGEIDLTCNGKDIAINDDGTFSVEVNLKIGENSFEFTSENKYHMTTEKTVTIIRTKPNETQTTDSSEPENTQDTDEDSNNQENEDENKVCDPSQGIDAGRNDGDGPGEFTPDPGTVNGEFIPSPQTGILSEYPLSGFTNISGRISTKYGKYTDNYNNRYDTFFDSAGHSFSSKNKLEYLLDNKYYWLSGTVYIPNGETYDGHGMLQIIGDGKVLYTSPDMVKTSRPIPFTVSLKGINDLVISYDTTNITLCLGNATIYGE